MHGYPRGDVYQIVFTFETRILPSRLITQAIQINRRRRDDAIGPSKRRGLPRNLHFCG